MVSKQTMIKFYEACGYGPVTASIRAAQYIAIQGTFEASRDKLDKMTDEDEEMMKNHINKQREQSNG